MRLIGNLLAYKARWQRNQKKVQIYPHLWWQTLCMICKTMWKIHKLWDCLAKLQHLTMPYPKRRRSDLISRSRRHGSRTLTTSLTRLNLVSFRKLQITRNLLYQPKFHWSWSSMTTNSISSPCRDFLSSSIWRLTSLETDLRHFRKYKTASILNYECTALSSWTSACLIWMARRACPKLERCWHKLLKTIDHASAVWRHTKPRPLKREHLVWEWMNSSPNLSLRT